MRLYDKREKNGKGIIKCSLEQGNGKNRGTFRFWGGSQLDFQWLSILLHAVYTRNVDAVLAFLEAGAYHTEEALGFALENGIGEVVAALAPKGIVPKKKEVEPVFGSFPSRYSPLDYHPKVIRS